MKHKKGGIRVGGAFTAVGVGKHIWCDKSIQKSTLKRLEKVILLSI